MAGIDENLPFKPVRIAVLTVSDTRTPKEDKSGALLAEMLQADGHELAGRAIVKDDAGQIRSQIEAWIADPAVDAIITTGGTGLTGRDVTPEAVRPLFEKEIDGFLRAHAHAELWEDWHIDHSVALARGRCARHIYLLRAGLAGRLQGRLDPYSAASARFPPPPLQYGGDHAAAHGAFALSEPRFKVYLYKNPPEQAFELTAFTKDTDAAHPVQTYFFRQCWFRRAFYELIGEL